MHFHNRSNFMIILERRIHLRHQRRRRIPLLCFAVCVSTLLWVLTARRQGLTYDMLISKQQELLTQLHRLEASYQTRQEEVSNLTSLFGDLFNGSLSNMNVNQDARPFSSLCLPSIYSFMPHLRKIPRIQPAHLLSQGRTGVSIVFGIPTIRRVERNYLVGTLRNIFYHITPKESEEILIVVLIAETDSEYVFRAFEQLQERFPEQLKTGLLDVISPPASFYPDMQSLRLTLGDNYTRVRWRSKQSLDYAFLMMYAQEKGVFYVQLEDDIGVAKNFPTRMKKEYLEMLSSRQSFLVMSFSSFGIIGKMMKSVELPYLIEFLFIFYNDQPVDWSIEKLNQVIMRWDDIYNISHTNRLLSIRSNQSLFKHIGPYLSLKRKLRKVKPINCELMFP